MSDMPEPVQVEEGEPPSPFALARDGISLASSHPADDLRQGLALLRLAREEREAKEACDVTREARDIAVERHTEARDRYGDARQAYTQALNEVTR